MEKRLTGKVIIVAGAGGIGNELARRYAREGASVLIGDIDGSLAETVAQEIAAAGDTAIAAQLDGADDASVKAAVDQAVARFGGLDGCHANFAGYNQGDDEDILGLPMEDFDKVMSVNARGFVLCTRHALPHLLARGGGAMVYTSSAAAYLGEPVRLTYGMSKAALHALMRHVARRFGPEGIRANVIAPGVILHPKLEAMLPAETVQGFRDVTLLKTRLGQPGDIAAMGALLMSDEGAFITGQVLSVDGGTIMRP
jgi:NAD(P)-dependent dehydrogenase (short-subunit alcohol dehydrogenase family)